MKLLLLLKLNNACVSYSVTNLFLYIKKSHAEIQAISESHGEAILQNFPGLRPSTQVTQVIDTKTLSRNINASAPLPFRIKFS